MKKSNLLRSCAFIAMPIVGGVMLPSAAFAQSTGTLETEKDTIVVTGTRTGNGIGGIVVQDSTKAKGLITQDYIAKQNPGQTIINAINYIPGATFTQNDPYGSSGGNIRIRGFDGNRVSVTFDGVPLNDSGNYAIYTNQILDPELVEQVNVNLGATDVDSPTASAAGGTINFRSLIPTDKPGVRMVGSVGSFQYRRLFGMVNTGSFGPWGTKAWLAASINKYDLWRGPGDINKWQINAKLHQDLGNNGDFISIAGHYNQNRNNNYSNPNLSNLRTYFGSTEVPSGVSSDSDYVTVGDYSDSQWDYINADDKAYSASCNRATPGPGAQVDPSACTSYIGTQINPSNTGNIRGQSRFTLGDGLILTVDPTFQYVLANGGSQSTVLKENNYLLTQGVVGSPGIDLNGDGDYLDSVLVGRPSITNTHRYTVLTSLVWRMNPTNTFRIAYTYDRAHHRQTGEYGYTDMDGNIINPFFGRNGEPIVGAAGEVLQNRDRTSIALLNQISGQYIGKFMQNRLRVELGLRMPFFKRDLDQHCYTPLTSNFPVCTPDITAAGYVVVPNDTNPATATSSQVYAPFKATYKYNKALPNIGLTYNITDALSMFASYAKGFSAPRTDNLYRQPFIGVQPETTNSFDLGARYITRRAQAQATLWKIGYDNRIVTSYDPETNISIDRNVGKVKSWGVDGSVGVRPTPQINLLALVSYTNAKLQEDLLIGTGRYNGTTGLPVDALSPYQYYCGPLPTSGTSPVKVCDETAGKFVVETPKWQYGGRAEFNFKPVSVGIQAKHVGDRWATDVNDVKSKGYTVVDLDARMLLPGANDKTYIQFNVTNLFNAHYFGNLSTSINAFGVGRSDPRFTPVASRSAMATISFGL